MKKHLKRLIIPEKTEEWYSQRLETIGASEIGSVMGLSQYKLAASVFLEKSLLVDSEFRGNKHTYFGTKMESLIADVWSYNDPLEPESYIENNRLGNKVRTCRQFNGILINPKYPHLSASLDRVICKGNFKITDGSEILTECPLEIKTIDKYAMNRWESGVPPIYILQVTQQMLISETDYAEIALLDSGKDFHVYPIEYRESLGNAIISESKIFWDNVLKARTFAPMLREARERMDSHLEQDIWAEVDKLIPKPKEGQEELYRDYLNERFNNAQDLKITGDLEVYKISERIVILKNIMKKLESFEQENKNKIMEFMGNNEVLQWEGMDDKVTWRENKRGGRYFRFDIFLDEEKSSILAQNLIKSL